MSNMSYCRFQNTASDFTDCVNAVNEMLENAYDEEMGGEAHGQTYEELSHEEKRALLDMAYQAESYLESVKELLRKNRVDNTLKED